MTVETLTERVQQLENRVQEMEQRLPQPPASAPDNTPPSAQTKRGWRWFVGVYADSPDFDEVERIGQDWRREGRSDEDAPS